MRLRAAVFLVAIVCSVCTGTSVWATPLYHVTYLGIFTPNGNGLAINSSGEIAGVAGPAQNNDMFVDSHNQISYFSPPKSLETVVTGVSDSGAIIGFAAFANSSNSGFIYSNGSFTYLPTLPGYTTVEPLSINANGQVAGVMLTANGTGLAAFSYSNGTAQLLGNLGGANSQAEGINAAGEIVGSSSLANGQSEAFTFSNGIMQGFGPQGAGARAINNLGEIFGGYQGTINGHLGTYPFTYSNGVLQELGTFDGQSTLIPTAINDSGEFIGNTNGSLGSITRPPFLYDAGTIYNLNDLLDSSGAGLTLEAAFGINDNGSIVAEGPVAGFAYTYEDVLLTPVPVPEPSTGALSAICVVGLLLRLRRRKS